MLIFSDGNSPTQHQSQFFDLRWKEKGESFDVLDQTRARMKFGVLKVSNQARALMKGRIKSGNASNLKADIMIMHTRGSTPP